MGLYDTIILNCPDCGKAHEAQTKSGDCLLLEFTLDTAPQEALKGVNQHSPITCTCGCVFEVKLKKVTAVVIIPEITKLPSPKPQ